MKKILTIACIGLMAAFINPLAAQLVPAVPGDTNTAGIDDNNNNHQFNPGTVPAVPGNDNNGQSNNVPASPGNDGTNNVPGGNGNGNGGGNGNSSLRSDATFLRQSAQLGLMEIQMAQVALSNSQNTAIQEFAQELLSDHTAQLEQLQALGVSLGVSLPDTLTSGDQNTLKRLQGATGEQFDRSWVAAMVNSHVSALSLHERAALRARNADVRNYANAQLVPLATHLSTALSLLETYRTATTSSAKPKKNK